MPPFVSLPTSWFSSYARLCWLFLLLETLLSAFACCCVSRPALEVACRAACVLPRLRVVCVGARFSSLVHRSLCESAAAAALISRGCTDSRVPVDIAWWTVERPSPEAPPPRLVHPRAMQSIAASQSTRAERCQRASRSLLMLLMLLQLLMLMLIRSSSALCLLQVFVRWRLGWSCVVSSPRQLRRLLLTAPSMDMARLWPRPLPPLLPVALPRRPSTDMTCICGAARRAVGRSI